MLREALELYFEDDASKVAPPIHQLDAEVPVSRVG
jgi:hypothetical protein